MSIDSLVIIVAGLALAGLLIVVLRRLSALAKELEQRRGDNARLDAIGAQNERLEREARVELAIGRNEAAQHASATRAELASNLNQFSQALHTQLASIASGHDERLK